MTTSFFLLFGVILLLLQTTALHTLPDWFGRPHLLLLLIVFLGTNLGIYKGALLVLFFGFLMDIFSGSFLGLHPVAYLLLFAVLQGASRHLAINESVHQVPLVVLSYLFTASIVFLLAPVLAPQCELSWSWGNEILQILMLAMISIPFFHFCKWITTAIEDKKQQKSLNPFRSHRPGNRYK